MIESLLVAVPKEIVPREETEELTRFERVTGIKKTRRYSGNIIDFIKQALGRVKSYTTPDRVIVLTQSPDRFSPCIAIEIHHFLGLPATATAFDVNHACDGWVLGVHLAQRLPGRTMLICADMLRYNPNPIEGLIFSDSVSVTIITPEIAPFKSFTDGSKSAELYCGIDGQMKMDGDSVFDFVTTKVPELVKEFLDHDYLAPHQANFSMNKLLEIRSGYRGRTLYSIEEYGNQSMNGVPCNLAFNENKILGKDVLCVGFGAGFSAAALSLVWPSQQIASIVEV
jgi:3-oxoacyl-[acyl-carrier-protein] synthase-3